MKKVLVIIALAVALIHNCSFAQKDSLIESPYSSMVKPEDTVINKKNSSSMHIILSPGISYNNELFGEVNIMNSHPIGECDLFGTYGLRIGIESNFNKNNFILGTKMGYEFSIIFLTVRGNVISYFHNDQVDLRIEPEVGFCYQGTISLTWGFNLQTFKNTIYGVPFNRISIILNLDKALWGF